MSCSPTDNETANKIQIVAGEDVIVQVTVKDSLGRLQDLTTAEVFATVKVRFTDLVPVIAKRSLNAGGSDAEAMILNQVTNKGKYRLFFTAHETEILDPQKSPFKWDSWVVIAGKRYAPVRAADFVVLPAVTANF